MAPFHGVNAGSNPAGDAILINDLDANTTNRGAPAARKGT